MAQKVLNVKTYSFKNNMMHLNKYTCYILYLKLILIFNLKYLDLFWNIIYLNQCKQEV